MTEPAVFTPAEVAELARVSEWTVCEWARTGVLPRLPGRKVRIPAAAVHALLEGRYDAANAKPHRQTSAKAAASRRRHGRPSDGPLEGEAVGGGGALHGRTGPAEGDVVIRRVEARGR